MSLHLPDSPRKLVYRALVNLYQSDPDLARTIKPRSWFVWDGRPDCDKPFQAPGLMPVAGLTPTATAAGPETEVNQKSPFTIALTVGVAGLNIDALLDLWSTFERVTFRGDGTTTAAAALNAALQASPNPSALRSSVQTLRLGQPAVAPLQLEADAGRLLVATGVISVEMLVPK